MAQGGQSGLTSAIQAANTANGVDTFNRQLHPAEVQVIKDKARDFAKALYATDKPTEQQMAQAQAYLVYAALADVDNIQMRANVLIGLPKDDQYIAAKQFLATQKDTFVNESGQTQRVFTTKGNDFYEPFKYANNNGNQAYRDFFWESVGINLPLPSNASAAEKQLYLEREIQRFKQDVKNALPGLVTGAVLTGVGRIASKANGGPTTRATQEGVKSPTTSASSAGDTLVTNNFYRDGEISPQSLSTSSKIVIRANPEKTTTVLGTYVDDTGNIIDKQLGYPKSLNYLEPKKGGFNLLNTPDELYTALGPDRFWKEVNEPFLKTAIDRGDDIYLATKPTALNTRNPNNSDGLSGFGREYKYLSDRGYVYDSTSGNMCYQGCKK